MHSERSIEFVKGVYLSHIQFMRMASRNRWKYKRMMIASDSKINRELFYRFMEEERANAIYELGRALWWKRELEHMMGAP